MKYWMINWKKKSKKDSIKIKQIEIWNQWNIEWWIEKKKQKDSIKIKQIEIWKKRKENSF